jgi:hypothetical protein
MNARRMLLVDMLLARNIRPKGYVAPSFDGDAMIVMEAGYYIQLCSDGGFILWSKPKDRPALVLASEDFQTIVEKILEVL